MKYYGISCLTRNTRMYIGISRTFAHQLFLIKKNISLKNKIQYTSFTSKK